MVPEPLRVELLMYTVPPDPVLSEVLVPSILRQAENGAGAK